MKNIELRKLLEQYDDNLEIGASVPNGQYNSLHYQENIEISKITHRNKDVLYISLRME
jgi:hypothetical protein